MQLTSIKARPDLKLCTEMDAENYLKRNRNWDLLYLLENVFPLTPVTTLTVTLTLTLKHKNVFGLT